ncbi:epoxide hydrolase [Penicillium angulare]|uniref:epoxide hydrolase n=1 Tax=Penicillium angulare TaxID=116970 RepID=UPI002541691D|nr:epoxide hydrolase [Penicillium angulare]KAJ5263144.1 epoxide hydrolase [Penicillium angulare]
MASLAFPSLAKRATLSDGTSYGYVAHPSSKADAITFLLLHGYPSSCYDWRHQIKSLSAAGGCGLLSRLVTYIPDCLMGIVPISVGYIQPGLVDIDAINAYTESLFGYPTYGYWPWHNNEDAVKDCDEHPASAFTLIYAANPEDWKINMAPLDAAAEYVKAAAMRDVNNVDEAEIPDADRDCHLPTLLVVSEKDYITRADMNIATTKEHTPDLRVKNFADCGHWIQLERPDELHQLLEEFALELIDRKNS